MEERKRPPEALRTWLIMLKLPIDVPLSPSGIPSGGIRRV
jgi:hypothetical protein